MKRLLSLVLSFLMLFSLASFYPTSVEASQIALYWPLPVDVVAIGRITSAFGPRPAPTAGASTNHRGIDLPAPSGTPVYSVFDGEVTAVGQTNARGNYVVIYHPLIGLSSLYQHLTVANVQVGDTVTGGKQVAVSGNTGVGTGAHLHYGLMVGKATNPNHDQPGYNMAMDPLSSNILYVAAPGGANVQSSNPDDYTYPTRNLYYTSPVLTGNDVRWVQAVLFQLGYTIGIDGSFGPATKTVVMQFQTDYGLDVDGSVGPATRAKLKELWDYKKNGNITAELHSWVSTTEYGDTPAEFFLKDTYYLNFEIIDSATGQKINSLSNKTYTVVMAFFNPDGSVLSTVTLASTDTGTLAAVPYNMGTYLAAVAVVGDIALNTEFYFTARYNPVMTASVSSVDLDLTGTASSTFTLNLAGSYPDIRGILFDTDTSVATATLGTAWDGGSIPITVTAVGAGSTTLTMNLIEGHTGGNSVVGTLSLPVNVSAPTYTVSYNANGGSGAPSAQTKVYGKTLTLSGTVPTRSGYTFLGWSESAAATSPTYTAGQAYTANAAATLYAVWQENVVLSSISVHSLPAKTVYYIGDAYDGSGLAIKLTYSNGTTETVASGFTVSGFTSATAGAKNMTVAYGGKSTTFTVTVKTPSVTLNKSSISMLTGETVTLEATAVPSGYPVTLTSSNDSVAEVSGNTVTAKSIGNVTVTASLTYNGITYKDTCSITIACSHKNTVTHAATASTCTVHGNSEYVTCGDCGQIISGTTEALPLLSHSGGVATCVSAATCGVCGQLYGEKDPDNHTGGTYLVGEAEATAEADGYSGDVYCAGCNEKLADGEVIPKTADLPGDIDGNGAVNSSDMTILSRFIAGLSGEYDESRCDVNGDGTVNSSDMTILSRFIAGLSY